MACDEEDICLVEKILDILQKNNIEKHRAFLITDKITELLSDSFSFKSTDINIDLGDVAVVSDNSTLNTMVTVMNNIPLHNITSIKWELNADNVGGDLNIKLMGFGANNKPSEEE